MHTLAGHFTATEELDDAELESPRSAPAPVKLGARKVPLVRPPGPPEGWIRPRWWHPVFDRIEGAYILNRRHVEAIARRDFPEEFTRAAPTSYGRSDAKRAEYNAAARERRGLHRLQRKLAPLLRQRETIEASRARWIDAGLPQPSREAELASIDAQISALLSNGDTAI